MSVSGGSTLVSSGTPERPDQDTPGSQTASIIGSNFTSSGSTLDYTGASGALLLIGATVSFSVSDDVDVYLSIYDEGTEIATSEMRVSCVAGNYYTVTLPDVQTTGSTNDTYDVRIEPATSSTTTTMHRYTFTIQRIY